MEARKLTGGDLDAFIENEVPRTQSWLYDTVMGFVNEEVDVFVGSETYDTGATFTIRVARSDMGLLIGKSGRMARTLRHMLLARARKLGVVYTLNIDNGIDQDTRAEAESDGNEFLRQGLDLIFGAHAPRAVVRNPTPFPPLNSAIKDLVESQRKVMG